jgi:hypothetical protein
MTYLLAAAALIGVMILSRRLMSPSCPRGRNKEWDRKLCAPLLFCRRCATRIDGEGRVYN